jgi:hypothetical protein
VYEQKFSAVQRVGFRFSTNPPYTAAYGGEQAVAPYWGLAALKVYCHYLHVTVLLHRYRFLFK